MKKPAPVGTGSKLMLWCVRASAITDKSPLRERRVIDHDRTIVFTARRFALGWRFLISWLFRSCIFLLSVKEKVQLFIRRGLCAK